jgi:hypothetical protein
MTPFSMAWSLIKADSKDPHKLERQQFQEGIQDLRDLFNEPARITGRQAEAAARAYADAYAADAYDGQGHLRGPTPWRNAGPPARPLATRLADADARITGDNARFILDSRSGANTSLPGENDQDREDRVNDLHRQARAKRDEDEDEDDEDEVIAIQNELWRVANGRAHARDADGGLTALNEDARNASRHQGTLSMPQTNLNRFDANFPDYPDHPIHGKQNISVQQRVNRQRDERDMKDAREEAKNNLIDNPPKLVRDEGGYAGNEGYRVKVGDKNVGHVMVRPSRFVGDNGVSIGAGEVDHDYQRQGLYGRALQAIMAEHGSVTSYNRNNNSGPFHEQFNPPHAKKEVDPTGRNGSYDDDDRVKYTHKPPEPIPGWGGITPDTGALPIYNERQPETMASTTVTGITQPPNYPGYANYGTRNKPMATSYPDWTSPETVNIPPPGGWRNVGDTF